MTTLILRRNDFSDSATFDAIVEMAGCEHVGDRDPDDELIIEVHRAAYTPEVEQCDDDDYEPDVDEAQEWADFDPDC